MFSSPTYAAVVSKRSLCFPTMGYFLYSEKVEIGVLPISENYPFISKKSTRPI